MLPRLWGNNCKAPVKNGHLAENGTGKFSDIDNDTLDYLKWLGCSHVWYTGIIRHSTQESGQGCIPSHPQFVKGKAGSPYAICDYYDVNAYLADDPHKRMEEFEELIRRTHEHGLKVIIDFVPNHVARDYGKNGLLPGHSVLGGEDDRNVHWSPDNDFFYYPGESLKLPSECPAGMEPYFEMPAMATGNNCYNPSPGINDWYETVKINYCDTHTRTWDKMYDIIEYWSSKGVDGFRCDMVELVPPQFFKWLIAKIKDKYPEIIFIAEVYKKDLYGEYIRNVGFDCLYDKSGLYDTLRAVVERNVSEDNMPVELWQSATGITRNWQTLGDLQPHMLNFLENHDEQRFASDFFGCKANDTMPALAVSLMLNTAPFMIYFGEEVGERGMDTEGFSGTDGRTTIFDWWSIPSIQRLRKIIKSGAYKKTDIKALVKAGLEEGEASLFTRFAQATRLSAFDLAITSGTTYDLNYCNTFSEGFDKDRHFAFLRDFEEHTLLIVVNFSSNDAHMKLSIPDHAFDWMHIAKSETLNPETPISLTAEAKNYTIITLI